MNTERLLWERVRTTQGKKGIDMISWAERQEFESGKYNDESLWESYEDEDGVEMERYIPDKTRVAFEPSYVICKSV